MTENELLKEVTKLCDERKFSYVHYPDSKRLQGTPGMPDLIILGNHRILWAELKSQYGQPSPSQTRWKYKLLALGQHYQLWRPSDLRHGHIARTLNEL